ncbi:MAG: putative Fe-S cluster assembly protein SufT [Ghiorsea sp.]|nr:putative Fe-S cluster assembly protein SufT [Ghiorsea sp.]MDQ6980384.1 putative Fe-S cluster assembly protein SufT [Ghiorsea sp.]MDQ7058353.1 putative Fe-S cluster assembly protein SufT [Ghiorsea sp.]
MATGQMITTTRDIDAILIPLGTPVIIPEGAQVAITQELGGTYTVSVNGNLARVEGKDADALGFGDETKEKVAETPKTADGPVEESAIWDAMKSVYDPEIPVDIVNLGLVYDVHVVDTDEGGNHVDITMTLTAPGCGMGPFIVDDVRAKTLAVENVTDVHVDLVFEPPWDRNMMSDEAKLELGMF